MGNLTSYSQSVAGIQQGKMLEVQRWALLQWIPFGGELLQLPDPESERINKMLSLGSVRRCPTGSNIIPALPVISWDS